MEAFALDIRVRLLIRIHAMNVSCSRGFPGTEQVCRKTHTPGERFPTGLSFPVLWVSRFLIISFRFFLFHGRAFHYRGTAVSKPARVVLIEIHTYEVF